MRRLFKPSATIINIGIYQQYGAYHIAFFTPNLSNPHLSTPHFIQIDAEQPLSHKLLYVEIKQKIQLSYTHSVQFHWITCLSPHHHTIWQKSIMLADGTESQILTQVSALLKEQLPYRQDKIAFDYHSHKIQTSENQPKLVKIQIIATRQSAVESTIYNYPLQLNNIDFIGFVLLRAFHFCCDNIQAGDLLIYHDQEITILIAQEKLTFIFIRCETILSAFKQLRNQYPQYSPSKAYLYSLETLNTDEFDYEELLIIQIQTKYPCLIALGCALYPSIGNQHE